MPRPRGGRLSTRGPPPAALLRALLAATSMLVGAVASFGTVNEITPHTTTPHRAHKAGAELHMSTMASRISVDGERQIEKTSVDVDGRADKIGGPGDRSDAGANAGGVGGSTEHWVQDEDGQKAAEEKTSTGACEARAPARDAGSALLSVCVDGNADEIDPRPDPPGNDGEIDLSLVPPNQLTSAVTDGVAGDEENQGGQREKVLLVPTPDGDAYVRASHLRRYVNVTFVKDIVFVIFLMFFALKMWQHGWIGSVPPAAAS